MSVYVLINNMKCVGELTLQFFFNYFQFKYNIYSIHYFDKRSIAEKQKLRIADWFVL
jgi:hypothetical protein